MDFEKDVSSAEEYYMTALQIFDYFGADRNGTLCVDTLMEKFTPFVKTNKAEYMLLKSLLDPNQVNPEVNVTMLSDALTKYSESQKTKPLDFEESFNLKNETLPQDSDSGISSDGFQALEELQCELREKSRLASQLLNQLDTTDLQHAEALATLTAERDSLKAHLNILREENVSLSQARRERDEALDRASASEAALADASRMLDATKRRAAALTEDIAGLESDKLILQELLNKSKDECHRINEMYASRQSSLIEQNEKLRAESAELTARTQQLEECMQHLQTRRSTKGYKKKRLVGMICELLSQPRVRESFVCARTPNRTA